MCPEVISTIEYGLKNMKKLADEYNLVETIYLQPVLEAFSLLFEMLD